MGTATVRIVKEMGVSHREFFRIFPNVTPGAAYAQHADRIVQEDGARRLEVRVGPQGERRLSAVVVLPVTRIELIFDGYDDAERGAFLQRFDRAFQKTAG